MSTNFDFFNAVRVNAVMQGAYDPRLNPQPLVWDKRIPTVPALDDEIMARFISFPLIADLIVDDAKAVTYSFGKFQFETTRAPKLKIGTGLNENMLRMLDRMRQGAVTRDEVGVFQAWESRLVSFLRYAVDVRREALLIAMLFDNLSYDRLGIKLNGLTWGMYADLKSTVATGWDNVSATPITDIQTKRRLARIRYGANYNRLTMSSQALIYAAATTEFQNQAKLFVPNFLFGGPAPASPQQNDAYLSGLFARMLSGVPGQDNGGIGPLTIELDDRRYWSQDAQGVTTSQPLWPVAGAVLSDSTMDGNSMAWDVANGTLIESMVANLVPGQSPPVPPGPGPVVYPALTSLDLNAPGISYWAVQRCFPRKHQLQANAALTVGSFGDTVSTALPF